MDAAATSAPTVADSIVSSRLLIVQSKRLILASVERRFRLHGEDSLRARTDLLRDETTRAHHTYRSAVLTWGRSTSHEFQVIAYSSLVNMAESLVLDLRDTIGGLPAGDQFEVATDVEMLEGFIDEWRRNARPIAVSAVA
jgi:hypothetical protein